jgi:hypothetical protein
MRAVAGLKHYVKVLVASSWLRTGSGFWKRALTLGFLLLVLLGISAAVPASHVAAAQLMYIPILLAASVWGVASAIAVGLVAALEVIWHPQGLGDSWMIQSSLYVGFAAVSALVLKEARPLVGGRSNRELSKDVDAAVAGRERILESLARTVEVRDHHTQGHCRRVARNSVVLGKALDLSPQDIDVLYWAALLHDIGKIAVPEYILLKNGRLSEDEFSEIRRHPAYGADLLASVSPTFRPIADIVRAHHERWDGFGYPLGYHGEEIPRLARIIAVVDVFEALTSERPYRSPMPAEQALRYVSNGAGTQFDPSIVPVFRALVGQGQIECGAGTLDGVIRGRLPLDSPAELTL